MNLEKLKNELELDEKLNVVAFESGVGDLLLYDNIMIINYGGNGYRIIFDDTHVLVQMLMIADITDNSISFDEACDYIISQLEQDKKPKWREEQKTKEEKRNINLQLAEKLRKERR